MWLSSLSLPSSQSEKPICLSLEKSLKNRDFTKFSVITHKNRYLSAPSHPIRANFHKILSIKNDLIEFLL